MTVASNFDRYLKGALEVMRTRTHTRTHTHTVGHTVTRTHANVDMHIQICRAYIGHALKHATQSKANNQQTEGQL